MTRNTDTIDLEALGLSNAELGPAERLDLFQPPGVARGYAATAPLVGIASETTANEVTEQAELNVEVDLKNQGTLYFHADAPLEVHPAGSPGVRADSDGLRVEVCCPELREPVGLVGPDRTGVLLCIRQMGGEQTLITYPLVLDPLDVSPAPVPVEAPLAAWCDASEDRWLVKTIHRDIADDPLDQVLAVGMFLRLERPGRQKVRQQVEATLEGRPHEELLRERVWARSLTALQLEQLEGQASARAELLLESILEVPAAGELDEELAPLVAELLRERDRLEGVRLVMGHAGSCQTLGEVLEAVDAEGQRRLGEEAPWWSLLSTDEERARGAAASPMAWWAGPLKSE